MRGVDIVSDLNSFCSFTIMTTKREILEFLICNKEYFRERFGIIKIGLYQSEIQYGSRHCQGEIFETFIKKGHPQRDYLCMKKTL